MQRFLIVGAVIAALSIAVYTTIVVRAGRRSKVRYLASAGQQAFLDQVQRDTFYYFWDSTPRATGLTPDRTPGPDISSIAAIGFALTSYLVGAERGYVSREAAAARTLTTLTTLLHAPQSSALSGVSGFRGYFYHFLDGHTGLRCGKSEISTIDTALLMAGVLSSQTYFDGDNLVEEEIRTLADQLYRRVVWPWAYSLRRRPLLSMGWSPETGFLAADWRGYNEGMLLYILALGSPTHPIVAQTWNEWTRTYHWVPVPGRAYLAFGPLFGHQYPHIWIDFRGIQDDYMRAKKSDYFKNSIRATYANRAYCIANPDGWKGYGNLLWGLTASDGPLGPFIGAPWGSPAAAGPAPFHAYWARGSRRDGSADDGTIAPTAAGGSVAFAPEVAIPTLIYIRDNYGQKVYGKYGFKDAFNLSYPPVSGWFDDQYVGIDQGPILLMIENYRTGFVWSLMKNNPYVIAGLKKAGFAGGWLAPPLAAGPERSEKPD